MIARALIAGSLLAATAHAQPTITVDDSVPFSAKELSDAFDIRVRESNAQIHIARSGDDIVVTVGDRVRAIEFDSTASHDLARVVALVIVSLADAPMETSPTVAAPPTPPVPPIPPTAPPSAVEADASIMAPSIPVAAPATWALQVALGWHAERGGEMTVEDGGAGVIVAATVSRRLTGNARALLGATAEQTHRMTALANRGAHTLFSAKAGVELRHRQFAVEGGIAATRVVVDCGIEEPEVSFDPYGAARVYLASVGVFRNRLFVEAGAKRVSTTSACIGELRSGGVDRPSSVTTIHGAIGIEVSL